jgi:hypothetical protein
MTEVTLSAIAPKRAKNLAKLLGRHNKAAVIHHAAFCMSFCFAPY